MSGLQGFCIFFLKKSNGFQGLIDPQHNMNLSSNTKIIDLNLEGQLQL